MAQPSDEPAPAGAEAQPGDDLPLIELETILNQPPSQRKRLVQIGVVLVAAVVLTVFWGSVAPGKPAVPESTPEPTVAPLALLIESTVNFGTFTINGTKQPGPLPRLIIASGESYDVTLVAPPFQPLSCHLSLSDVITSDNLSHCRASRATADGPVKLNGVMATPTFELDLFLGMHDLPLHQQSQITALLTQPLQMQQDTTVPVGSYFASGFQPGYPITSQIASAPLRASATVAPAAPQNPEGDSPCVGFICPLVISPEAIPSLVGHQWGVTVEIALRWRLSTTSGAVVGDVLFQGDNPYTQVETSINLFLSLDTFVYWTISQHAPVPNIPSQLQRAICSIGQNVLTQIVAPGPNGSVETLHDQGAQGCEWRVLVNGIDQGIFLWCFGVLLAADARADAAYPELPIVPAEEILSLGW